MELNFNKKEAKCFECGDKQSKGNAVKVDGKYYCRRCAINHLTIEEYEELNKEMPCDMCRLDTHPDKLYETVSLQNNKTVIKVCEKCYNSVQAERKAHKELVDYIYEKHNYRELEIDATYIVSRLKILKATHPHFKNAGILASLKYYYEICGNDIHKNPYNLVPYIYDDAREFHRQLHQIRQHNNKMESMEKPVHEVVHMKAEEPKPKAKITLIDLDSI